MRCMLCKKKYHEICVLYHRVSGSEFYCKRCRERENIDFFPVRAKSLPESECDVFINNFLKQNHLNRDDSLTIRLLSKMKNLLDVKTVIQDFRVGPTTISFQNCSLFVFFNTDQDTDICFFSIFFQLYGTNCEEPNRNTDQIAYVSYIDSVNLYPMACDRTLIYRTILLGLFDYLKTQGFLKIYLWSCPPKQNQDYIFYMKPPAMKIPKRERLASWYIDLFKLGQEMGVIESYRGVHEYANAENWRSISDIPYMDGDLWIVRIEEAVQAVSKEITKLQVETLNLSLKCDEETFKAKINQKELENLRAKFEKKLRALEEYNINESVWQMMKVQIEGFNKEYFIIQLSTLKSKSVVKVEKNQSDVEAIDRFWVNDRSSLVDFLWENMLEFSSERRAQFSTYVMLYRIFAESKVCVKCSRITEKGVTVRF